MNFKKHLLGIVIALILGFVFLGCEGDIDSVSDDEYGSVGDAAVSFRVQWPDRDEGTGSLDTDEPSMMAAPADLADECDARDVDKVRVGIQNSAGSTLKSATFDCSAGQGRLTGIAPQSGCSVVVSGLNYNSVEIYQGRKTGVTLHVGMNHVGTILLQRINGDPSGPSMPSGDYTNSIGMTFNYIEPGTFMMGSPLDEPGRNDFETQHQVTLTQGYYMQTTPVTQGQWEAIMGSNPSYFSNCGADCPVENVSWNDAQDFISALNALEGATRYALPTEAQWEYAARAGSAMAFANGQITETGGDYDPVLDSMGWYRYNSHADHSPEIHGRGTHPVAQKDPNAWGLYDMHGNVYEWVADWFGSYSSSAVIDPIGPASGINRVLRGGGALSNALECRSANRGNGRPDGTYGHSGGLRLILFSDH